MGVVCTHALGRVWWFLVRFCVWRCFSGVVLHIILGFLTYARVAEEVWDAWARNILVCHTFASPWSVVVRVWSSMVRMCWCFVLSLFSGLVPLLLFCFPFFFLTCRSRLAPMARTLLGVLGHATQRNATQNSSLSRLACSWRSVCVLSFATSQNSGVKLFGGFLRSQKTISLFIFVGCSSFSSLFFFLLLRSCDMRSQK